MAINRLKVREPEKKVLIVRRIRCAVCTSSSIVYIVVKRKWTWAYWIEAIDGVTCQPTVVYNGFQWHRITDEDQHGKAYCFQCREYTKLTAEGYTIDLSEEQWQQK